MTEALVPQLDKDIVRRIQETTQARALALHAALMDRLEKVLNGEDDKAALTAVGLILKIGAGPKERSLKIHHTFDDMMRQSTAQPGQLAGLTQIVEGAVIDAEDGDIDDDNE